MKSDVNHCICEFITRIFSATNTITDDNRRSGKATLQRVAGLLPVAEEVVVADGVHCQMLNGIGRFIAVVERTSNEILGFGGRSRATAKDWMAGLCAVTPGTVIADRVLWCVNDLLGVFVAIVRCAADAVGECGWYT